MSTVLVNGQTAWTLDICQKSSIMFIPAEHKLWWFCPTLHRFFIASIFFRIFFIVLEEPNLFGKILAIFENLHLKVNSNFDFLTVNVVILLKLEPHSNLFGLQFFALSRLGMFPASAEYSVKNYVFNFIGWLRKHSGRRIRMLLHGTLQRY